MTNLVRYMAAFVVIYAVAMMTGPRFVLWLRRKICHARGHYVGPVIEQYEHDFRGWHAVDRTVYSRVHHVPTHWLAVHRIKGKIRCANCGALYIGTFEVHRPPE